MDVTIERPRKPHVPDFADPGWPRRRARQIVSEVLTDHALRTELDRIEVAHAARAELEQRQAAAREAALAPFVAYGRLCGAITNAVRAVARGYAEEVSRG